MISTSVEMSLQVFNVKESKEVVDIAELLLNLSRLFSVWTLPPQVSLGGFFLRKEKYSA